MAYTKEQIEKAKAAKSVEELIAIAKAEGIELSEKKATVAFARLHADDGEISAEELANVAGGGCGDTSEIECPECHTKNPAGSAYCSGCGKQIGEPAHKIKG